MAMAITLLRWRRNLAGLAGLGFSLAWALPAQPAPFWLGRALHLGDHAAASAPVARYAIDTGGGFVLDRSGRAALLRFDDSPEVWSLTKARGPRGDVIYFNDLGQPFLRTTKLGGVTVFTRRRPDGSAATLGGAASPLRLGRVDPGQVYQRMVYSSARASRAAQHLIGFQALDVDAESSGVIADAAWLASETVAQLAIDPRSRGLLARVARIDFVKGRSVGVAFAHGIITVTVVPKDGVNGRPSSARIAQALTLPTQASFSP